MVYVLFIDFSNVVALGLFRVLSVSHTELHITLDLFTFVMNELDTLSEAMIISGLFEDLGGISSFISM